MSTCELQFAEPRLGVMSRRTVEDPAASAKAKVAARLLRIEKGILQGALAELSAVMPPQGAPPGAPPPVMHPKLS